MTEKFTRLILPGQSYFSGLLMRGERTVAEMLAELAQYTYQLEQELEAIDKASLSNFKIDVVRGSIVQHHVKSLQKGRDNA